MSKGRRERDDGAGSWKRGDDGGVVMRVGGCWGKGAFEAGEGGGEEATEGCPKDLLEVVEFVGVGVGGGRIMEGFEGGEDEGGGKGGGWWVGGGSDVFVAEMHGDERLGADGGGLAMKGEAGTGSPAEMRWEGRRRERQDVAMRRDGGRRAGMGFEPSGDALGTVRIWMGLGWAATKTSLKCTGTGGEG